MSRQAKASLGREMPALGASVGRAAPHRSVPELLVTSVFKDNLADFFFPPRF